MIENVPDTMLGRLYREHIRLILEGDVDAILQQYTEDAVLLSSFEKRPLVFTGHAELRQHFQGILAIKDLKTSIGFWGEVGERMLMVTEGIELTAGDQTARMRFADSWVLRDGKIMIHFAGMVQYPDGSLC